MVSVLRGEDDMMCVERQPLHVHVTIPLISEAQQCTSSICS